MSILSFFLLVAAVSAQLQETQRVEAFHKRGYQWPPPLEQFRPPTEGWRDLHEKRFDQTWKAPLREGRYDGWLQAVMSAYTQPNFTENGWGLTRAPESLVQELRAHVRDNYNKGNYGYESRIEAINAEEPPIFISGDDFPRRLLEELKPIHEAWSGQSLTPSTAYGFRLYQNQSALLMHVDKPQSHVISSILHVDSSDDAEPWPIVIEDYHGNTNEVILTPGDMLFYESSKCFHGRPENFNGSWYSSIFVHYRPSSVEWTSRDAKLEGHYGVPPGWNAEATWETDVPPLEFRGTSQWEPSCYPKNWCAETVQFYGPGEVGVVLSTGGKRTPLFGPGSRLERDQRMLQQQQENEEYGSDSEDPELSEDL